MVADFCRNICQKLMICPNLFGPLQVVKNECPDRCHKTWKTKFTSVGTGKRGIPKGYTSIMDSKPNKPCSLKGRKRRGRWANRDKDNNDLDDQNEEMPYLSMHLTKNISNNIKETFKSETPLSEIDCLLKKGSHSSEKFGDFKNEVPSNNGSDDSRSSDFNDRKRKDSNLDSPGRCGSKSRSKSCSQSGSMTRGIKTERGCDESVESGGSDDIEEYVRM